jgi:multidrug resistance efflux pump
VNQTVQAAGQTAQPAVNLLQFQRKLQQAKSLREAMFVAVNDSFDIFRFSQAVFWQYDFRRRIHIGSVSALAEVTGNTPYSQWLISVIDWLLVNKPGAVASCTYSDLPDSLAEDGSEWMHDSIIHCRLHSPEGEVIGGILFHREEHFTDAERALAEWTAQSAGFALWGWRQDSRNVRKFMQKRSTKAILLGLLITIGVLAFMPVRLSALAPAEITPVKPLPITSPVEGVVGRIVVQPNQEVRADQVLVELEDTSIRNRLAVAIKGLDTARADYQRAANKAFSDEPSRAELVVLDSRAREKAAEVSYLTDLLTRLRITAPQGGIAIFSDAEDWRGRPVQPGERIMTVANPARIGVTVYVPPQDAVQLSVGGEVTLFLDTAPLAPLKATIVQTSYETTAMPDNTLAYIVKASLPISEGFPRIGLRGTAKVYGEKVSLGYYLLRKPIIFLRKSLGF